MSDPSARGVRTTLPDGRGSDDTERVWGEDGEPDAEQEDMPDAQPDTEPDTEPDSEPDAESAPRPSHEGQHPKDEDQLLKSETPLLPDKVDGANLTRSPAHPLTLSSPSPSGVERAVSLFFRRYDRLPRAIYLHRLLVQRPTFFYLLLLGLIVLTAVLAVGAALLGWIVPAICLLPLGLAFALLWRRGPEADAGGALATLLTVTGLAILGGTQAVYLKDFLSGGEYYRMNTLFKFFSQVWVMWGIAAAIAVPRIWSGWVSPARSTHADARVSSPGGRAVRWAWAAVFALLLFASLVYPVLGTPTRLDTRMVGWRPPIGTLNGLDFMRQSTYTLPDGDYPIELRYEYDALQWLLRNVSGNRTILESSQTDYYRYFGTKIASYTGLSTLKGMHEQEQRYPEDVGYRDGLLREIWDTGDVARTQQIIDELRIDLIYVGQLESYLHPGGAARFAQMAANGQLSILYQNERVTVYATNWFAQQAEAR